MMRFVKTFIGDKDGNYIPRATLWEQGVKIDEGIDDATEEMHRLGCCLACKIGNTGENTCEVVSIAEYENGMVRYNIVTRVRDDEECDLLVRMLRRRLEVDTDPGGFYGYAYSDDCNRGFCGVMKE